jgi:DNA repair protein RadC
MTKNEKECVHSGHRQRLTDLVSGAGLENVSEIQAVEFLLTYVFPRGDVNPLAHSLLERYGSFSGIIDAEPDDLAKIKGISTQSAKKINLIGEIVDLYYSSKVKREITLDNSGDFLYYLENLIGSQPTEQLYLFAFDSKFALLQKRKFSMKRVREVGISPFELYSFLSATNASYLIVAHNHPNGKATPSVDDNNAIAYIEKLIEHHDCKLLDSLIVGANGIYSEKQKALLSSNRPKNLISSVQ